MVAGMSGVEIAYEVLQEAGELKAEQALYSADRSPEYWTGWALAYYQWSTSLSFFAEINQAIPVTEVRMLYTPYHEMDVRQFVDKMNELYREAKTETNLKELVLANLSQSELAQQAGVSVLPFSSMNSEERILTRRRQRPC